MLKNYFIYAFLAISTTSFAQTIKSDIPMAVDNVITERVGKQLVRIIQYNTEMVQKFSVELIKPPKMALLQRLDVTEIQLEQSGQMKPLKFSGSAGVYISAVKIEKDSVVFKVEHFGTGHTGGSTVSDCAILIEPNRLGNPVCKVGVAAN